MKKRTRANPSALGGKPARCPARTLDAPATVRGLPRGGTGGAVGLRLRKNRLSDFFTNWSALPCPETLVDAAIGIPSGLLRGQLLLHPLHPGAERLLPRPSLRLWSLQVSPRGSVVGRPALRIEAPRRVLAFLALPSGSLGLLLDGLHVIPQGMR